MYDLYSPRAQRTRSHSRGVQLMLEQLEERDQPSTLSLNVTYGSGRTVTFAGDLTNTAQASNVLIMIGGSASGTTTTDANGHYALTLEATTLGSVSAVSMDLEDPSNMPTVTLTDQAPTITSFEAIEGSDRVWTFQGHFTYHRGIVPMDVHIMGMPASLMTGQWIVSDTNGDFSLTLQLNGQLSDNGNVWAAVISPWNLWSSFATDDVQQTGV